MKKHSHDFYVNKASKGGCRTENGKKHTRVYPPNGVEIESTYPFMCIPRHRTLADGTERSIVRWLLKCGIILAILLFFALLALLTLDSAHASVEVQPPIAPAGCRILDITIDQNTTFSAPVHARICEVAVMYIDIDNTEHWTRFSYDHYENGIFTVGVGTRSVYVASPYPAYIATYIGYTSYLPSIYTGDLRR